jgi:REP element-mobilizing transposase RayT
MREEAGSPGPAAQGGRGRHSPTPPSDLASLEAEIRELAKPRPIYTPKSVRATHSLRYDWTGWLSDQHPFPPTTHDAIRHAQPAWQSDGLALTEFRVRDHTTQILFASTHEVSPVIAAKRIKGRLQHAFRQAGTPVKFSRKVALRSLGDNTRPVVEGYLGKQVDKEGLADPRFVARMKEYTVTDPHADLSAPTATHSGHYWYNLHLVMVTSGRRWITDYERLAAERDGVLRVVKAKGYILKSVSVMPDHVHVAFRGDIEQTPEEIALSFMNNLSFLLGRNRVWEDEYYVGTFSEYGADVVNRLADRSFAPATQGRRGRRRRRN